MLGCTPIPIADFALKPVQHAFSRLLQHTPGLPRMELIVGRLQHLFYMTYQLKHEEKKKNVPATGKQILSWILSFIHYE